LAEEGTTQGVEPFELGSQITRTSDRHLDGRRLKLSRRLVAKTILIVDDYAPFRETARSLLEAEGFEVIGEAENGVAALRVAKELHPEIVLLDVQLPDFDGFEVAERLRRLEPAPEVILTSSRDDYGPLIPSSAARGFVRKDELSGETLASALR
jgi:DNA-binding NarL/FixJ family response regulator